MTGDGLRCGAVSSDMDVRLAEIAREALVGFEIELLVAEEYDTVRDDGRVHLVDLPVAQWPGQIDIADLGADMGRRGSNGDGIVAHEPDSNRCVTQGRRLI